MRRRVIIGASLLGVVALAAAMSLSTRRYVAALVVGRDGIAYHQPRVQISSLPGPPRPRVSPAEAGIDPAVLEAASIYAGARKTQALIVARGGHIVYEKYWGQARAESVVDLSGFTPVLTAIAVGIAINDRRIFNLDDPLSIYLPEWREDPRGVITVRQLLARESGLQPPAGWPAPGSSAARFSLGTNLPDTLLTWPAGAKPALQPGTPDVEVELLALLLARVSKQSFAPLLAAQLWQPLGAAELSLALDREAGNARASCCVRARIGDWMRVGEMLANGGSFEGTELTPPRYVSLMLTPTHAGSPWGLFVRTGGPFVARDIAWLEADGRQRMWIVPSLKLVILRVGGEPGADAGWDEAMIPDSIVRGTSGWRPAEPGKDVGIDPKRYAPH